MLGETPWVDRNLRSAWERIAAQVPSTWLPRPIAGSKSFEEFACGHYGCVMPTNEPGLVVKLTSDVSEAGFVSRAMTLPKTEGGLVEYRGIFALEGQKHKGRQLFVLWRSEAKDIGIIMKVISSSPNASWLPGIGYGPYEYRVIREAASYLKQFLDNSRIVREYVVKRMPSTVEERRVFLGALQKAYEQGEYHQAEKKNEYYRDVTVFEPPSWQKGLQRVGSALNNCYAITEHLENTPLIYLVGKALQHYMDNGILLADVHYNNIGRDDNDEFVITDPGHAVEFDPRWAEPPQVPVI